MRHGVLLALGAAAVAAPFLAEASKTSVERLRRDADGAFTTLPGLGITHFRWRGPAEGPVTVCIHGLTTPSYVWDAIAEALAATGRRVLTYDLFGRGFSDRPSGAQDGSFFVAQLEALLSDRGVSGPVELIGYSMGGSIATVFAARAPDRVRRLILLAPAGLDHAPTPLMRAATDLPGAGDWLMRALGGMELRKGARDLSTQLPEIAARVAAETRVRGYLPAVLSSMRHMLAEDLSETHRRLADTELDLLAIWGGEDRVIPLAARDRLAVLNPASRHVTVPEAGHALPMTHAPRVLAAMAAG